jgi:hypothetical protein
LGVLAWISNGYSNPFSVKENSISAVWTSGLIPVTVAY